MTDALMVQAVREDCVAVLREHVGLKDVLIVLASTIVFVLHLGGQSHWLWSISGLPAVIFSFLGAGWVLAYFWLPRVAKSKLAPLPHRRVQIEASDNVLSFQTANERLEVAWAELKSFTRRPNFWIVSLRSGMRVPIPAELVGQEAESLFIAHRQSLATA